jgi:uncharacterized protein with HEPN domain
MNDEIQKLLFDVKLASEDIIKFINNLDYSGFLKNKMVQKAVEREFEIIGEALNRIKRLNPEIMEDISEHHRIIGFRNILTHGYDVIDEKLVWDAVTIHLPILQKEIKKLIEA